MARTMEPTNITYFETPAAFGSWLAANHNRSDELWVGFWKKATGRPSVTWPESVDEALCYGWIDGIRKRVDDEAYTIRFTPRRARSTWSHRNMERFAALDAEDRIAPPGREAYEARTEENSGIYSFEQEQPVELSPEFKALLRAVDEAHAYWRAEPPGYRRTATFWVMSAKRQETRRRRMDQLIGDSAAGRRVPPLQR